MLPEPNQLQTESDVEQKLIFALLTKPMPSGLQFGQEEICTKPNIRRFEIDKGSSKKIYYPDYVVVLAGLPVLVVEVKKPGEDVDEALREARLYATELNALHKHGMNPCARVVACNGSKLLSCPTDQAEADVNLTLAQLHESDAAFADFIEKACRRTLNAHAAVILSKQAAAEYFRPLNMLGGTSTQNQEISNNTFGADIASRFRHLFNPTTREDRRFIAMNAYVPSKRRHQYVEPIDRIIRAAVPPSLSRSRPVEDTGAPAQVLGALKKANRLEHEVLLLVGSVGSGKTTFVDYLREVALSPDVRESTEWIHLNMNESPLEQVMIYDWLLDSIAHEFQRLHPEMDFASIAAWELVLSAEINRFRNTVLAVLPKDSPSRSERLADEYQRLITDKSVVANAMLRYFCVERGKALVLVLDNCDKRTLEEQLLMFQVAQWVKEHLRCLVFLPLRDVTYDLYRSRPPLDTALKDLVFHIEPPMFSKVLARRIRLALDAMAQEDDRKKLRFVLKSGFEVEYPASDLAMYLVSLTKSLFEYDRIVRRLITALAGRDVRRAMELFLEFCTSGHISENDIWRIREAEGQYVLPYEIVVRVLLRMNRRFYDGDASYLRNLLQCNRDDPYPDNFVRMAVLRWLQVKFSLLGPTNVTGYHQCRALIAGLIAAGHDDDRIRKELQYLVRHGCIVTEHQDKDKVADDDLICISPSGWVHLDLLGNVDYLAACAEDVWYGERDRAQRIAQRIGAKGEVGHYHHRTTSENAKDLVEYLQSELAKWDRNANKFLDNLNDEYLHSLESLEKASTRPEIAQETLDAFGEHLQVGDERKGRVTAVKPFGAFIRIVGNIDGLLHISRFAKSNTGEQVPPRVGDLVGYRITRISNASRKIDLELLSEPVLF